MKLLSDDSLLLFTKIEANHKALAKELRDTREFLRSLIDNPDTPQWIRVQISNDVLPRQP